MYAPPTVTMSFAVPGVPMVPGGQVDAQLPAANTIVMSGWAQTNMSTILACRSYTFAVPPQLSLCTRTGANGSLYTSPGGPNRSA